MRIYFPRIKQYFIKNEDIKFNAIINKLAFDKLNLTESEVFILAKEFQVSYCKSSKYEINTKSSCSEMNLSYSLGIYIENFYNSSFDEFKELIIKNIKMRIAPPMISIPINILKDYISIKDLNIDEVLLLAVGISKDMESLVLISPLTGEYFNITFNDINNKIFKKKNGVKWIMLNSPNMAKPQFRKKEDLILQSLNSYAREFLYNSKMIEENIRYGKKALINWCNELKSIDKEEYYNMQHIFKNLNINEEKSRGFGRKYLYKSIKDIIKNDFIKYLEQSIDGYEKIESYIINTPYEEFNYKEILYNIEISTKKESEFWIKVLDLRRLYDD